MSGAVCSVGVFVWVLNSKGTCLSSFEHDPVENDKDGWQRRSRKNKIGRVHEQSPHKRLAEPRKQSFALAFSNPKFLQGLSQQHHI